MDLIRSVANRFFRPSVMKPEVTDDIHRSSSSNTSSDATSPLASTKGLRSIVDNSEDVRYLSPICYSYDPVAVDTPYLEPAQVQFQSKASRPCPYLLQNSVRLHPARAGLPYRSSLDNVRGSKYFADAINESNVLLKKIMEDNSAADVPVGDAKITLAKLAEHELRPGLNNRLLLVTSYMFPAATERRLRIIALDTFREDFFSHFDDIEAFKTEPVSEFHRYTQSIMKAIKDEDEDEASGNGGKEMINGLLQAFQRVHPNGDFQTLDEYLEFRRSNVGSSFVVAAAKFTIKSSVDIQDARFSRYLSLIGDHLGIVNDMASYEKEARALRLGETKDMINIVSVFHRLLSLPDENAAKAAVYAYQLQVESWIMQEIERLAEAETLTDEEWWFLEVVQLSSTGNTMFCMTSARYGGQTAAIEPMW